MILLNAVNDFFDMLGDGILFFGVLCAALFGGLSNKSNKR